MKYRIDIEPEEWERYSFWGGRKPCIRYHATGYLLDTNYKSQSWHSDASEYGETESEALWKCRAALENLMGEKDDKKSYYGFL